METEGVQVCEFSQFFGKCLDLVATKNECGEV